jgi:hypothetical protein
MVLAKLKAEAARLGIVATVAHSQLLTGYFAVSHRGNTTHCCGGPAALAHLRNLADQSKREARA